MELLKFAIKVLIILAMVLLMVVPFALEFFTFRRDKAKKITYKIKSFSKEVIVN